MQVFRTRLGWLLGNTAVNTCNQCSLICYFFLGFFCNKGLFDLIFTDPTGVQTVCSSVANSPEMVSGWTKQLVSSVFPSEDDK